MYLLLLVPLFAAAKVIIQGALIKEKVSDLSEALFVNGMIFGLSSVLMAVLFLRAVPSPQTLLLGVVLALCNMTLQVAYAFAFRCGPVSLTSIINNFNIVVPIVYGLAVYNEKLNAFNAAGMLFLAFSSYMILYRKGDKRKSTRWIIFTVIAFIGSALSSTVLSVAAHSVNVDKKSIIVCAYFIAALLCFTSAFLTKKSAGRKFKKDKKAFLGAASVGLSLGLHSVLLIKALGIMETVTVYPVTGLLTICFIALGDITFFKQRFTKLQLTGAVFAGAAIVLLNL